MIEKIQLLPGAELRCFRDDRFCQGCLSIQFIRKMDAAEASMNALLPNVLLRGTGRHPDLRSITMKLDDLYGAGISPLVRVTGDYQTTGFYCSFMEPRFAMPGDRVLEPLIEFLGELLYDYPVCGSGFDPDFTESEKHNLISSIEAELNDKAVYASGRLLQTMCSGDPFGVPRLGTREQVEKITPESLLAHWKKVMTTSPVQLVYVGSEAPEVIAELLKALLQIPGRMPLPLPAQTPLAAAPEGELTETMEVSQAKLCMGFTTPDTINTPENAAAQMLNMIFGGGMTSKLFLNVREKQSLCYSIGSGFYNYKGIMTVSAGIDADMREKTQQEILHQLELCRSGCISDEEMTAAREALTSGLRAAHDSPGAIESFYASSAIGGVERTPEELIRRIRLVTREQVAEAARRVKLHTVYFLKGGAER